jgi:hypothetical protein
MTCPHQGKGVDKCGIEDRFENYHCISVHYGHGHDLHSLRSVPSQLPLWRFAQPMIGAFHNRKTTLAWLDKAPEPQAFLAGSELSPLRPFIYT